MVEASKIFLTNTKRLTERVQIFALSHLVQQCVAEPTILFTLDKYDIILRERVALLRIVKSAKHLLANGEGLAECGVGVIFLGYNIAGVVCAIDIVTLVNRGADAEWINADSLLTVDVALNGEILGIFLCIFARRVDCVTILLIEQMEIVLLDN